MRVAIDVSPLQSGHKVRGVGFYLKHLKDALERSIEGIDFQYFSSISEVKSADLIHYPYFDPFSRIVTPHESIPTVVTIHDLTPIKFSSHFPVGVRGKLNWQLNKRASKRFAGIITDSESSKKDIATYLSYPDEKISVAYLAAGEQFTPKNLSQPRIKELNERYNLPEKFVLYVGDVTWNKNVPRLIRACIKAEIPLVMVGKALAQVNFNKSHSWNSDLVIAQDLVKSSPLVTVLGFIEDEDLVDIYRMATLLAMPSLYEGFGLPIVEAMQTGIPVVASREGSLPEVGGEAVYYVDAYGEDAIAKGIEKVFSSSDLLNELSKKGILQAKMFSWKRTADETVDVYNQLRRN